MNFDEAESSAYQGTPVRFFDFSMGPKNWHYVGNSATPILVDVELYVPDPLLAMGSIQQALGEVPPSVEFTISATSEIAQYYLPYMPPEPMYVRVRREHEESAPGEFGVEFIGEIVTSSFDENEGTCTLTAKMTSSALSRRVPWPMFTPTCTWVLYGPGCGLDREAYATETTIVGGADGITISSNAFATAAGDNPQPEQWFRNGWLRHVLTGEVRTIVAHEGVNVYLQTPFTRASNGDQVIAYAGCDRTRQTCKIKFNNFNRAMIFPWIPGRNAYTQNVYGTGQIAKSAKSKTNWRKAINPAGWNGAWGLF